MSALVPFSIFHYSSPLEFLQDAYEHRHSHDESFSYESIATACGLKSRTHARNIFKGIQKPNSLQILKLAELFGLGTNEQQYLALLFRFRDATANPVAFELFQQLIQMQKKNAPLNNPFREIEVATSVLHMTLLSVLDLPGFEQDPEKIADLLKHRYSRTQIDSAIHELESYGYITRDASTERWKLLQRHLQKIDLNSNFFLRKYHAECLEVAKDALENEAPSERYLVGATFGVHEKVFPRIVQKMNAFIENLMQLEQVAGSPDTVVQITQQLVKMTTSRHAENGSVLGGSSTERVSASKQIQ